MLNHQQFENSIKKALFNRAESIEPSDNMFDKIESEIKWYQYIKRETFTYNI